VSSIIRLSLLGNFHAGEAKPELEPIIMVIGVSINESDLVVGLVAALRYDEI